MLKTEPYIETGLYEPPWYILKHGQTSSYFCNILRVVLLGHLSSKQLTFEIPQFRSDDFNLASSIILTQLKQVHINDNLDYDGINYYVENKTQELAEYKTSHLFKDGKPLDLKKYGMSDYRLGHINVGCFMEITGFNIVDSKDWSPVFSMNYLDGGKTLKFRSFRPTVVSEACDFIIDRYKKYKGLSRFEEDEGMFGMLISDIGFDMGYDIKCRREFFTIVKFTDITGPQDIIDKIIDKIISIFENIKSKL